MPSRRNIIQTLNKKNVEQVKMKDKNISGGVEKTMKIRVFPPNFIAFCIIYPQKLDARSQWQNAE